jgi:hypothetical protein
MQLVPDNNTQLTEDMVIAWLGKTSREQLHNDGWVELNRRAHAIALGARDYANRHYEAQQTPEEREAFFDGVTFGVLLHLHGQDVAQVQQLLMDSGTS